VTGVEQEQPKAEEDCLEKEEVAAKMHADQGERAAGCEFHISRFSVSHKLTSAGGGKSGDSQEESE